MITLLNIRAGNQRCMKRWSCIVEMALGHDRNAVLDARLRVRGVGRLRVIDASAMPRITSGNTNSPTIMIAEKGAGIMLEDAAG